MFMFMFMFMWGGRGREVQVCIYYNYRYSTWISVLAHKLTSFLRSWCGRRRTEKGEKQKSDLMMLSGSSWHPMPQKL